jgi:heme-degrading monooxygenase HmoA
MVISLVRFKSRLAPEEIQALYEERAHRYQQVPGLLEKIYLSFRDTGEASAVYLWESEEAHEAFRRSDLSRSIAGAYEVEDTPTSELADVALIVDNRAAHVTTAGH